MLFHPSEHSQPQGLQPLQQLREHLLHQADQQLHLHQVQEPVICGHRKELSRGVHLVQQQAQLFPAFRYEQGASLGILIR